MTDHTPPADQVQRRFLEGSTKPLVDTKTRTCELSFSSASPVAMPHGIEVLSHEPGAADLSRLNQSAPLLFNHDANDILGVVERASISNGKGRAVVRFGKDARGEWAMRQAADGVLANVSFSYRVSKYQEKRDGTLVAIRWEATEISLVTVPADNSVGIGRSMKPIRKTITMSDIDIVRRGSAADDTSDNGGSRSQRGAFAAQEERERIQGLIAMGRKYELDDDMVQRMIGAGSSIDDARERAADVVRARGRATATSTVDFSSAHEIGMSNNDIGQFSICKALAAQLTGDWTHAGLEREASRAVSAKLGRQSQGIFVPMEVMKRSPWQSRAAYTVGTPGQGGNLVEIGLAYDYFTEALRNESQVIAAGATMLTGLVGNVDIPRRITTTQTYWVAESGPITEAEATFEKIQLRPKTLGALSKMSRLALMQTTPAIETLTRADMLQQIGLGIDLAALSGTGASNQPLGIFGTAGIGALIGGANGANITIDTLIALESLLANSNAPVGTRGYLLNTKAIATLKSLKASTGQYLWTTDSPGQRSGTPPSINGYGVFPTNQLRSNLTKGSSAGVCSELVFGAWNELIVAQWGVLEIIANPFDTGFAAGDITLRAMQTVDIAVRHAASFAVMSDALTP